MEEFLKLEEVLLHARENISCKKYRDVINLLEKYRLIYKGNEDLLLELGKAYFLSTNFHNSKTILNAVLKINGKNIYALDLLAKICLQNKEITKAINLFNEILQIDNSNFSIQKELLNVYLIANKYSNIIRYFENNHIKESLFVYYVMSLSYIKLNDKNKAIKIIGKFFKTYNDESNSITKKEIFNIARAFVSVDEYDIVVKLCNLIDIKKEYKDINHFYNTMHFKLSKYLQDLRINSVKNNNFIGICDKLLSKIPGRIKKIRNIILNEKEIYKKCIFLKSKPRYATFVLTTKCNLKCKMCHQANINWYMNDKQIEQIKKLIPYLQYVTWHGGEVFFHNKFWNLFEFANLNDVEQEIITNGTLIKDWMLEKLLSSKLQLTLSMDAINKRDYENIRVGAKFDKIIDLLVKLKNKRKDILNNKFILKLNVIVSKINYKNISDFIDFANNYNINKIYFFPLNNMDEKSFYKEYDEIVKYLDKNMDTIIKKANDLGIEIETNLPTTNDLKSLYGNFLNNNNKHEYVKNLNNYETNINFKCKNENLFCVVPWQRIRVDEYISPYCFCKNNIGKFLENVNLFDVWNNEYMKEYRTIIKNNKYRLFCNTNCLEVSSKIRKEFKGVVLE